MIQPTEFELVIHLKATMRSANSRRRVIEMKRRLPVLAQGCQCADRPRVQLLAVDRKWLRCSKTRGNDAKLTAVIFAGMFELASGSD